MEEAKLAIAEGSQLGTSSPITNIKRQRSVECTWTPSTWKHYEADSDDSDQEENDIISAYNNTMKELSEKTAQAGVFQPLTFQLAGTWDTATEQEKTECVERAEEGCKVVCDAIAPNAGPELFESIYQKSSVKKDCCSAEMTILMTAYRDAPSKSVKMQILSIYAFKYTARKLIELHENYESISRWQIKRARKHAKTYGPGAPVEKPVHHRVRLPMPKVDHFLDFIDRPYFYQDVAYGTRTLKLDSGEEMIMPNVIRTMTRSTMVAQYLQHCEEDEFSPLSRSTLFKILEVREASQRKSLQGLNNTAADGASGFQTLERIVDELGNSGVDSVWCNDTKTALQESKRYLKSDYRIHCSENSQCPDHCFKFALSDLNEKDFKENCEHSHGVICESCEKLKSTITDIRNKIENSQSLLYNIEHRDDLVYDFQQAKNDIYNWKAHIVRSLNQDRAKQDSVEELDDSKVLIVMDWAMKFQQLKYREKQSEWFGKRGLSWHVSSVVIKNVLTDSVEVQTYVHLFDNCTQDWYSVASIIENLLLKLKKMKPSLKLASLRSDEAGCYHNNFIMAALTDIGRRVGVSIERYDYSEPNYGKDICDRIICPLKGALKRYCNEGNDVLNANDMHTALRVRPVRGTTASVCCTVEKNRSVDVKAITNFSKYHNFRFQRDGVSVWKAYDIGQGKFIPFKQFCKKSQVATGMEVERDFFDLFYSRDMKAKASKDVKDRHALFECPDKNCNKVFSTLTELETHIDVGKHVLDQERNVYDQLRREWATKFSSISSNCSNTSAVTSQTESGSDTSDCCMGWALRSTRPNPLITNCAKKYLAAKFDLGELSGQKADPNKVALDMRTARDEDNKKLFKREEWLKSSQIKGFFSRLAATRRRQACSPRAAVCEEECNLDELQQEEDAEDRQKLVEKIADEVGLKHPVTYDCYDLCNLRIRNKLDSFNVAMLREILNTLQVTYKCRQRKSELLSLLKEVLEECSCMS